MLGLLIFVGSRCRDNSAPPRTGRTAEAPARDTREIEQALVPAQEAEPREGVAAAIVIDVSGSMDDRVTDAAGRRARKIDVARRAARDLVAQFAAYASEHPTETVSLGIFEFSRREGRPDCRPIIPMGAPDPSKADEALARLDPEGGTPIGQAMITAKLALDATGLSRRHLLLVSDGENTDGYRPDDVAAGDREAAGRGEAVDLFRRLRHRSEKVQRRARRRRAGAVGVEREGAERGARRVDTGEDTSGEVVKFQLPSSKSQGTPNAQVPTVGSSWELEVCLGLGAWECLGIWNLELGIYRVGFPRLTRLAISL